MQKDQELKKEVESWSKKKMTLNERKKNEIKKNLCQIMESTLRHIEHDHLRFSIFDVERTEKNPEI